MSTSDADASVVQSVSSVHTQGLQDPVADVNSHCEQLSGDLVQPNTSEPEPRIGLEEGVITPNIAGLVISKCTPADSQPKMGHAECSMPIARNATDLVDSVVAASSQITLGMVDDPSIEPIDETTSTADIVLDPVNDRGPNDDVDELSERLVKVVNIGEAAPVAEPSSSSTSNSKTVEDIGHPDCVVQQQSVYQIKWVKWKDSKVPIGIVTQNENGPCPLIAVMNVLLLLGKVKLSYAMEIITSDQLMEYLGDCILESAPKNISEGAQLNYEQNMHDAIAVLPKMQTGLDVNVKFTGVHDFEYTPECIIFDLLNIPLYHGWLVDPQAREIVSAVGKLSYNQLVEKIITNKSSTNSDLVTEALIAENFLEKSASQLTYYGLCELNEVLKANELAILFRNNHFCTVFKHEAELLQLVTDQGFLNESNVVWETLSNIEGDCQFVDANFATVPPKALPAAAATASATNVIVPSCVPVDLDGEEQIQHDYLVALSLQEEQKREEEKAKMWQEYKEKELGVTDEMTDEELARRLHADEQRLANEHAQAEGAVAAAAPADHYNASSAAAAANRLRQSSTESKSAKQDKKKSDCTIL